MKMKRPRYCETEPIGSSLAKSRLPASIAAGNSAGGGQSRIGISEVLLAFSVSLVTLRMVQLASGAPQATFGAFGDEVAHFMGGVLVRDYLIHPFRNPLRFAQDYYVHFPYFAIG